ncbi:maleylpyruvate isomerase family mycothiol-dependent enzyme [Phytoactinopolyspora halotolerans]|uniref:Maleylpyruvate isomerase family mycothiol-dependent enzyme n=1 Tax=Phytoactinopolyspora halotolerans TaxID=1981512 RepID=A0A6L9SFV0_9ACTN|nr:maleylpyruvate isomerase family mycothiol-dependent enzyme [Phytoactinopolyspora halotolerans]NEE03993.1 maleylpyruvate isomerase family mycothiol-dependent enzyme [Phytoactinopolyspora halotolerans]
MRLSHERYIDHVRADAERIAAEAERGQDLAVPSCPGWTVRDVVEHTAEVYQHKVACMRDKRFPDPWPPERDDEPTLDYFRRSADELLTELSSRDPLEFAETWWWDERTVGFWGRRMAHETAIHRVDVELAHDALTPVDAALALDGIDEVLRLMLAGDWSDEPYRDASSAIVRARAADEAWRIVMEPMAVVAQVDRWPDMPVDATVTGEPSMLYLWLWRRGPGDSLTVDGDASVVDQLHARMAVATQ